MAVRAAVMMRSARPPPRSRAGGGEPVRKGDPRRADQRGGALRSHLQADANTSPQKHSSQFDGFTDRVLPALQEALLARMPQLAYAGAVDNNGYFPTHNKKFSQPLTGDYDVDLVNNRTKRIFSDRTGKRCGANTKPSCCRPTARYR
jgi:hypothetical protein